MDNLTNYMIPKQVGKVTMMTPLENNGPLKDAYINSGRPVYYDPFNKMVENDPRVIMDLTQWVEDAVEGNEYFVDDADDYTNPGGTLGWIIEYARELRKAINRSVKSCKEELEFLGLDESGEAAEVFARLIHIENMAVDLEELIDIRRSGIMSFMEYEPSTRIKDVAEVRKKLWLAEMVIGGVLRRDFHFREFERWYSQWNLNRDTELEESKRKDHKEWREKKWKQAHGSLYRAVKNSRGE